MTLRISNRQARHLWLRAQGVSSAPTGPLDVMAIIRQLGFVQLDTIRAVSRAHHHIIWSRNQAYREPMLNKILANDRQIFEHFTHDASVLPVEMYPLWQRQFQRFEKKLSQSSWYAGMSNAEARAAIKSRITEEGPLSTKSFTTKAKSKEMWARPPHKLALDYMWYVGELATSHRESFSKFYDLTERVIPVHLREDERSDEAQIGWLCEQALSRLAFGSEGEIMRFWGATTLPEVKAWRMSQRQLVPVEIENSEGAWMKAFAPEGIEQSLSDLPPPTTRLRILNPFDPVVRDRKRLLALFGMEYRIEIFVPEAKRKWGYYVFPILEGDRIVGRIDMKADRGARVLNVLNFWPEPSVIWPSSRWTKLDAEIDRLRRFIGVDRIEWHFTPERASK